MGDSGLVSLALGHVYLIWGISIPSYGAVSLVAFSIFPGIGDEYSLPSSRSMPTFFSHASTPSSFCPPSWGFFSLYSMLQQRTNKTLTTSPFRNTCKADEVSPEVEAGVVA
jgi:hypothetical protein